MDGQEKYGISSATGIGNSVVVSKDKARFLRNRSHLRLIGLVIFCIIIIAAFAVAGLWLIDRHHKKADVPVTKSAEQQTPDLATFTSSERAEYYSLNQQYASAISTYESQLKLATTKTAQAAIYLSMGSTELSAKNYNQAYNYGLQADQLDPTYSTAKFVAYAAQMEGSKNIAIKYYKIAISRVDKSLPNYNRIVSQIQQNLNEVSND